MIGSTHMPEPAKAMQAAIERFVGDLELKRASATRIDHASAHGKAAGIDFFGDVRIGNAQINGRHNQPVRGDAGEAKRVDTAQSYPACESPPDLCPVQPP